MEEPRRGLAVDMLAAQQKSDEACISRSHCLAAGGGGEALRVGVISDGLAPEGQPLTVRLDQNGPAHPRGGFISRTKQ